MKLLAAFEARSASKPTYLVVQVAFRGPERRSAVEDVFLRRRAGARGCAPSCSPATSASQRWSVMCMNSAPMGAAVGFTQGLQRCRAGHVLGLGEAGARRAGDVSCRTSVRVVERRLHLGIFGRLVRFEWVEVGPAAAARCGRPRSALCTCTCLRRATARSVSLAFSAKALTCALRERLRPPAHAPRRGRVAAVDAPARAAGCRSSVRQLSGTLPGLSR